MPNHPNKQPSKSTVNDSEVISVLDEADIENAALFIKSGRLNFKLPFTFNDDKKTTIWHILILCKELQYTNFLKTMLLEYKKKYGHDVIPEELNSANENGLTPILLAAFVGNLEAIRILCAAGADPTINDATDGADATRLLIKNHLKLLPELKEILQDYRDGKYRLPTPIPVPPPIANNSPPSSKTNPEGSIMTTVYGSFSRIKAFFTAYSTTPEVYTDDSQQRLLDTEREKKTL